MNIEKDLVAASSVPLVLSILSEGDNYGYAIIKRVKELSGTELEWSEGMLYPVLHKLERQGWVTAYWDNPEGGRRRKYYRLEQAGLDGLSDLKRQWDTVDATLRSLWDRLSTMSPTCLRVRRRTARINRLTLLPKAALFDHLRAESKFSDDYKEALCTT